MGLEPFEQRTGEVQHRRQEILRREMLQDWPVHIFNVLHEDMIKVPDGLMQMEAEDESDRIHSLAEDE